MYSVWFCDLPKVIEAINKKLPNLTTFCSIEGNAFGDFVIHNGTDTWIVKHDDFSVWHLERTLAEHKEWVEVK